MAVTNVFSSVISNKNPFIFYHLPAIFFAILFVVFYPRSEEHSQPVVGESTQETPAVIQPSIPEGAASAPVTAAVVAAVEAGLTRPSTVVDSMAADVPTPAPSASPVAAEDTQSQVLLFRARNESWVQIRDASGTTILQKLLAAGESLVAPGKPPYFVVVGKADATEVVVRGKVLDLTSVSRDNVARFEVRP